MRWISVGSPQLSTIYPSIITLFKVLCRLDGEPDSKVSPQLSIGAQQVPSVAEQLPACEHLTDFPRLRLSYLSCRVFRICNIQILKRKKLSVALQFAMHTAQPAHERNKFLDKYINQNVYIQALTDFESIHQSFLAWVVESEHGVLKYKDSEIELNSIFHFFRQTNILVIPI